MSRYAQSSEYNVPGLMSTRKFPRIGLLYHGWHFFRFFFSGEYKHKEANPVTVPLNEQNEGMWHQRHLIITINNNNNNYGMSHERQERIFFIFSLIGN